MSKWRVRRAVVGAIGLLAVAAAGASVAEARARPSAPRDAVTHASVFDGRWSVVIETERGGCDRSYRVGLDIVNGVVTYDGSPYGRVTAKGSVRVRLTMGDQHADGAGRLSRMSGKGVWRGAGSSGACSGRWFAERRD